MKVFCLGNILHSDDGVAVHLLPELEEKLSSHDFVEAGTSVSSIKLPDEGVVFIDAVYSEKYSEGRVLFLHKKKVIDFLSSKSSHDFYLKDIMREEDVLIGIIVKDTSFGDKLSSSLLSKKNSILKSIISLFTKNF